MTDRLANLILLAEQGLGWRQVNNYAEMCATPNSYIVLADQIHIPSRQLGVDQLWDPYTSFSDAGMLMRALGIDLERDYDRKNRTIGWIAIQRTADHSGEPVQVRAGGNTKAAQCAAVCECALKIIKRGITK